MHFLSTKMKAKSKLKLKLKLPFFIKNLSVYFTPCCWVCYEIAAEFGLL